MSGLSPWGKDSAHIMASFIERLKTGDVRTISHAITLLDLDGPERRTLLDALRPLSGGACIIGVTGYPGAGKSTLIDQLITAYRSQGKKVGVLAVDTSSPFTGGAILGDRIRMHHHELDDHVYIRSMATRGHHGGLSRSIKDAVHVLDVAGFDVVLIETIGVGQEEGEIAQVAQTVVVVVTPDFGDEIQAMKAGILEVAHLVVVNKADHQDTGATIHALQEWVPNILATIAHKGKGIKPVLEAIASHQQALAVESHASV